MRYWIFVTKPENYKICVREEIWGVDERYLGTLKMLKPGKTDSYSTLPAGKNLETYTRFHLNHSTMKNHYGPINYIPGE